MFFLDQRLVYLLNPNPSPTTGLRPSTSPSSTLISTATGCHHSFAQPLMLCTARATRTRTRSLQTTMATSWPSMATRNTSASSDPSSQGTIPMTRHLRPHSPLTAGESPGPGPGPAPTPDPGPIRGRMGPYPREAPVGPPA